MNLTTPLGASFAAGTAAFNLWAPKAGVVEVRILGPNERSCRLERDEDGYHFGVLDQVAPGARYLYRMDGKVERADPASRFQPEGVHGPSEIVEPGFAWEDQAWFNLPLRQYIFYELHIGAFSPEGTFDGVAARLDSLKELGVTAIEIMPVAQFPGTRNWGYDGVYPFAVQNSYGGPAGLKRLVDACHRAGLAVVLDVVYNHLGPEGNYLSNFGPYFTNRYQTPWGEALNFDGPESDHVRRFFIENALYWQTEFHIDALRLDAVHAIYDFSAVPFLEELALAVEHQSERLNRRCHLIAETDQNDPRVITGHELGGWGLHAHWSDDFHHGLHVALTGEQSGYYADYDGVRSLAKLFRQGYAYTGNYSLLRKRRHGRLPRLISPRQLVVCSQNHDQVGNRMLGDRLAALISFEALKVAAGMVLLSPFAPLLFMGEEYGETAPFQYFTSHGDAALIEAVRAGRREEFAGFQWEGEAPDPHAQDTFDCSRLNHSLAGKEPNCRLRAFYRELIALRKRLTAILDAEFAQIDVIEHEPGEALYLRYASEGERVFALFSFCSNPLSWELPVPAGHWSKSLDSRESRWGGPGSSVPKELQSFGHLRFELEPESVLLFELNPAQD
jgi:maltooligosyltrehalose trehalohydrolase